MTRSDVEFGKEAATLQLPAGDAWPKQPLRTTESGSPEWYQEGFGTQAADDYWFCSWASTALKATDADIRHNAVGTLTGIFHLYYYTHSLSADSRPLLQQEVAKAQRGDLSALRNDVQLNC